ncbi:cytochrome P450 [Spinellus fusiger]|nr:cytochrome P450 [Spinellus fusiger]
MDSISSSFLEKKAYVVDLLKDHPVRSAGVVVLCTALYAIYSSSKDKKRDGLDKIPMPKGNYPLFGHIPHFSEDSFFKVHEWHNELGPMVHVKMGVQDFVFISDTVLAHEIFNTNGNVSSGRPPNKFGDGLYSLGGRGMVFPNSKETLRSSRHAVNSILSPKSVDQMSDIHQLVSSHFVDQLIKNGSSDEGLDAFSDITFRSLNVMLTVCLGTRFESKDEPDFKKMLNIIRTTMKFLGIPENIEEYIPSFRIISFIQQKDKQKREFIDNIRDPIMKSFIAKALKRNEDSLIKRINESDGKYVYDKDDMMVLLSDLLIAGTDTASVTIYRAFLFLSHHPEVQKKICEEVDTFIEKHKRLPTFAEREEFPYIISVQREIMRLYPITAYGVPHTAEQDFVFNNYLIKKGTILAGSLYSMHRDPKLYPDPEKFIPDRFVNNKSTFYASAHGKLAERDQFNFGWGRRMCPGIYLVETEMFYAYTTLWANCTIVPALDSKGNPVYEKIDTFIDGGVAIMPAPYKVRFIERPDRLLK